MRIAPSTAAAPFAPHSEARRGLNLLLLLAHRLSLQGAARRISRRFGVELAAVVLADGSQAIDVDNERSHNLAEQLLGARTGMITKAA
jgi:hypothetical protein